MIHVFIDGEAGTTGLQIRDRLKGRTDIELVSIDAGRRKDPKARRDLLNSVDIAVLCLPDDAAKEAVSLIDPESKTRVIDASTAFRVASDWTYGFPELSAEQSSLIAQSGRVSNPGCWPQGFIALVRPLVKAGLMSASVRFSYHGVSGYSGGGRKMVEEYEEKGISAPSYLPYSLTFSHKHLPEMQLYTGVTQDVLFEPAVGRFAQGMLTSVPLHSELFSKTVSLADIHEVLTGYYQSARFVEVAPLVSSERSIEITPEALNNTNRMRLFVMGNESRKQFVLMSVYDNLGKGASGSAVQNLNLMIGADEASFVDLPIAA